MADVDGEAFPHGGLGGGSGAGARWAAAPRLAGSGLRWPRAGCRAGRRSEAEPPQDWISGMGNISVDGNQGREDTGRRHLGGR